MFSHSHTTDQVVYLNIVKSRNNNSSTEGGPVSYKDGLGRRHTTHKIQHSDLQQCARCCQGRGTVHVRNSTERSGSQPHPHLLSIVVEAVLTNDGQPAAENEELW